jgi:hypothetical protein
MSNQVHQNHYELTTYNDTDATIRGAIRVDGRYGTVKFIQVADSYYRFEIIDLPASVRTPAQVRDLLGYLEEYALRIS